MNQPATGPQRYVIQRYIREDGGYDLDEDLLFLDGKRVPAAGFFYPNAHVRYFCDADALELALDPSGRPTCQACGRQARVR